MCAHNTKEAFFLYLYFFSDNRSFRNEALNTIDLIVQKMVRNEMSLQAVVEHERRWRHFHNMCGQLIISSLSQKDDGVQSPKGSSDSIF